MHAFVEKAVSSSVGKNALVIEYKLLLELAMLLLSQRQAICKSTECKSNLTSGAVFRSVVIIDKIDEIVHHWIYF